MATGDFNGDGRPDLVLGGTSVTLEIGDGGGRFHVGATAVVPGGTSAIAAADWNGDGRLDVLVLTGAGEIVLYYGNGAGSIGAAIHAAWVGAGYQLLVGDFDGDGVLDVASSSGANNTATIAWGAGGPPTVISVPFAGAIAAADFDGDGVTDFAIGSSASSSSGILIYRGLGNHAFARIVQPLFGSSSFMAADVDGDGKPDIIAAGFAGGSYETDVYLGIGDGTFALPIRQPTVAVGVNGSVVDFNGDGHLDLVGSAGAFLGDGTGNFSLAPGPTPPGNGFDPSAVADFDGDGHLDLAIANIWLTVAFGVGDGSFARPATFPLGSAIYPSAFLTGDINGDGIPDVMATAPTGELIVALSDGAGGFSGAVASAFPYYGYPLTAEDLNGDGKADLVVSVWGGSLLFLKGDGTGHFAPPVTLTTGLYLRATGDFDGDHKKDLLVVDNATGATFLMKGDGAGHFATPLPLPSLDGLSDVQSLLLTGDVDGNGTLDVVGFGAFNSPEIRIALNDGTGQFSVLPPVPISYPLVTALIADLDGDGKADVVTSSAGEAIAVRRSLGGGALSAPTFLASPFYAKQLFAADVTGDGRKDIIASNDALLSVFVASPIGIFSTPYSFLTPGNVLAVADTDGDSQPDLTGYSVFDAYVLPSTRCKPRRVDLSSGQPACPTAGSPFPVAPQVRVVDDGGSLVCYAGSVTAALVAGTGPPSGALIGNTTATAAGGVATFGGLGVNLPGRDYRIRFSAAGATPSVTSPFAASLPPPAISGSATTCATGGRFDGGAGWDAYRWTLDGAPVGANRFFTLNGATVGAHTLALTVTLNGCQATASLPITANGAPATPVASSGGPVAFGGTIQLFASTVPGAVYEWSGPLGFTSNLQNPTVSNATPDRSGVYRVVARVAGCSSAAASVTVVVSPAPVCGTCLAHSFGPSTRVLHPQNDFIQILAADFDRDGTADLVTLAYSGPVLFWRGDGHGGFDAPVSSPRTFQARWTVVGDVDGDGLPDLVGAGNGGVSVLYGAGAGRFGGEVFLPTELGNSRAALADVDRDGILDIVVAGATQVYWIRGKAGGGFYPAVGVFQVESPFGILAADFDGDGKPDLAVSLPTTKQVLILGGDGAGNFSLRATLSVPRPPDHLAWKDVTGDGIPDLLVGNTNPNWDIDGFVSVFEGSAAGVFTLRSHLRVLHRGEFLVIDVNGDARNDLVTIASDGVSIRLGEAGGLFASPTTHFIPKPADFAPVPASLAAADVDGDGRPDLLVGSGTDSPYAGFGWPSRVEIFLANASGFDDPKEISDLADTTPYVDFLVRDINHDGHPDLIVGRGANGIIYSVDVSLSDGAGGYLPATRLSFPPSSYAIGGLALGDVNGDGQDDLLVFDSQQGQVFVFPGSAGGVFQPAVTTPIGRQFTRWTYADFNGDGRLDLVLGDYATTAVYLGTPSWSFVASGWSTPYSFSGLVAGDFDGDGKMDLAGSAANAVKVFQGNGLGAFFAPISLPVDWVPNQLAAGDFDGDGKTDLVVGVSDDFFAYVGHGHGLRFFRSLGGMTFAAPEPFGGDDRPYFMTTADFNGEGKADIVATSRDRSDVAVYTRATGTFQASRYEGGAKFDVARAADVDGDGRADVVTFGSNPASLRFLTNTRCVPRGLAMTTEPACGMPGVSLPVQPVVRAIDDGGNLVSCDARSVNAAIVPGTGAAGAVLNGTTTVPEISGVATFTNLSVDRAGLNYRLRFSHPIARSTSSRPFSIGPAPSVSITGPAQVCGTATYDAGAGYDTYVWSLDGVPISVHRTVTVSLSTAGSRTLSVTVQLGGCSAQASKPITNLAPQVDSVVPAKGTSGGGTSIVVNGSCFGPGAKAVFDGTDLPSSLVTSASTISATTLPHAVGPVNVVVRNADSQTGTLVAGYTFSCPPPVAGNDGPVCAGGTIHLTASTIPGATYSWTGPGGFTSSLQNPTIPSVSPSAWGYYTVTATSDGCTSSPASTLVLVNPAPTVVITAPPYVCAASGGNVASVFYLGAGASFAWTITNGTIVSGDGTSSIVFTAGATGSVGLQVTVTDAISCQAIATSSIPISTVCGLHTLAAPCRAVDTRDPDGPLGGPPIAAASSRAFVLAGVCGIPVTAKSVVLNVAVTAPSDRGDLRLFPGGTAPPLVSAINYAEGQTRSNNAIIPLGTAGDVVVLSDQPTGEVHLILDVSGWFE